MAEYGRSCLLFSLTLFLFPCIQTDVIPAEIEAIASISSESRRDDTGSTIIFAETVQELLFIGRNFSLETSVAFTLIKGERGDHCESKGHITKAYPLSTTPTNGNRGSLAVKEEKITAPGEYFYICVKQEEGADISWIHQGQDAYVRFAVSEPISTFMPLGVQIAVITLMLCLSGLFSGLNLGLMALDKTELKIIERCGNHAEKKYAKVISPLRKRGNFLLCTLLLGNVLVNNSLTILLDNITNGLVAVVGATAFIVVFGEIVPQALCSRHGLAVGAKTRYITYLFMILTFPLSFPISLLLDRILGEEIGQVYNREKLQELIRVTKDFSALDDDEVAIISGALTLTKKTVSDIMTRIEDVFMLDFNDTLNFETMSDIMKKGYSRIPVYENEKSNIVALLNIKDLALIDPDDNTPLKTVCKFYQHHLLFVFDDHKLDSMLQDFRQGHSHMAIVRRVNNEGDGDPYYETLGVVTLEDVIEEIIQSEIIDETDTRFDNNKKMPRMLPRQDFSVFNQPDDVNRHVLPPQLSVAAFQFLSTSVEAFMEKNLSDNILRKLIKQNIVVELNPGVNEKLYLYKEGIPCDYFVLILQGHVEVNIGREGLVFSGGPFSYYGVNALTVNEQMLAPFSTTDSIYVKHEPYIPDFTVRAIDTLLFLRIKRPHYIVARRATLMGRAQHDTAKEDEAFNKEWKHLSQINQCNHNNSDMTVEVHGPDKVENVNEIASKPVFSGSWTPIHSATNISGMMKRTDSKDSGWSFPASDRQVDTSESDHEATTKGSSDKLNDVTTGLVNSDTSTSKSCEKLSMKDGKKLECANHDRTSNDHDIGKAVSDDCLKVTCDNVDYNDEDMGSGEFIPLVVKDEKHKQNGASGDS